MRKLLTSTLVALGLTVTVQTGPVQAQASPYLSQIMWVGFNFCPRGWAPAHGQILPINQNQSLYSLLGTTYGGDGRTTFALPDLRGRAPIGMGNGGQSTFVWGERTGLETTTLNTSTMPAHSHTANVKATAAGADSPASAGASLAGALLYTNLGAADTTLHANSAKINAAGGGQSFNNMSPYLVQIPCIAMQGLFPSRN